MGAALRPLDGAAQGQQPCLPPAPHPATPLCQPGACLAGSGWQDTWHWCPSTVTAVFPDDREAQSSCGLHCGSCCRAGTGAAAPVAPGQGGIVVVPSVGSWSAPGPAGALLCWLGPAPSSPQLSPSATWRVGLITLICHIGSLLVGTKVGAALGTSTGCPDLEHSGEEPALQVTLVAGGVGWQGLR